MSWGLVLSGGTAFGIANVGVLSVLERENLRPDCIAGSSMGAIVGALWACGHTAETLLELASHLSVLSIASLEGKPWKGSLHEGLLRHRVDEHLSALLGDRTIGDCDMPFVCVAGRVCKPVDWTRIVKEGFTEHMLECVEPYVFPKKTRLLDAVMASSALPVIFRPVTIGDDSFVDLVSFGSIPARELQAACHPAITVCTDTNPRYDALAPLLPKGWKSFLKDGLTAIQESRAACDLVIAPSLTGNQFRFDKAKEFYKKGEEAAEKALPGLRALLRGRN